MNELSDPLDAEHSVAIIGMAARVPGAETLEKFWENLRDGVCSIRTLSDEALIAAGVPQASLSKQGYVKAAATIPNPGYFDGAYFGYSPKEAEYTDPQQRIFLECALHALESAGCDPSTFPGTIGVFAGCAINMYQMALVRAYQNDILSSGPLRALFIHGNDKDHLATRVSYKLNLRGPSMTVQTACSTSLVAVHQACQSLLCGECDVAIAGASSVVNYRAAGYHYVEGGIQSPDGMCRPFDEKARGTVFGDGAGIVVLKKLDQAMQDGDTILAVLKGTAINNDGANKVGYTAPSVDGQAMVVAEALSVAGLQPEDIQYIETHGTATELGDPIEIAALEQVYRPAAKHQASCALGAVKANIGHLNTAAGIAGLIKVVLALQNEYIPPTINHEKPNPRINFGKTPFYVNTTGKPWPRGQRRRRAGVSSFGIGGTNAHVIVEEAPVAARHPAHDAWRVSCLSAKSTPALEEATDNLAAYLQAHPSIPPADVAHTLATGRKHHDLRRAVVHRGIDDLCAALQSRDPQRCFSAEVVSSQAPIVFLFPGQGSQRLHMGRQLYADEPIYRQAVDECAEYLAALGMNIRQVLFPEADGEVEAAKVITLTQFAQPALFITSYALAKLWMEKGVHPDAMVGHSIGELVAACLAGVMSLRDAIFAVHLRGQLMQSMPPGVMLAVSASQEDVAKLLDKPPAIAAVNSDVSCVIAGTLTEIEDVERTLGAHKVYFSRLRTSHAFHSSMMEPAAAAFSDSLRGIDLKAPEIPFISNATGDWIDPEDAVSPDYWGRQLLSPVQFSRGIRQIVSEGASFLLEVGAGRTLSGLATTHDPTGEKLTCIATLPYTDNRVTETEAFHAARARLFVHGAPLDMQDWADTEARKVPLPGYPLQRNEYWPQRSQASAQQAGEAGKLRLTTQHWKRITQLRDATSWQNRVVVVMGANDRFSAELGEAIRQGGGRVVTVATQPSPEGFAFDHSVNMASLDDYIAVLKRLAQDGLRPDTVIYWPGQSNKASEKNIDAYFFALTNLVKAWQRCLLDVSARIVVLTRDGENVLGTEMVDPFASLAKGVCFVAGVECENLTFRIMDLTSRDLTPKQRPQTVSLVAEKVAAGWEEAVIALRNGAIWKVQRDTVALPAANGKAGLRDGGVYVITGGTGDLGLAMADGIIAKVQAHIVLLGRTAIPPRENWAAIGSDPASNSRLAAILKRVAALEAGGSTVSCLNADISNPRAVRKVFEDIRETIGRVDGVIHAAGIGASGAIDQLDRKAALRVMGAKVHGTMAILNALAEHKPDFIALFSSISALGGYIELADYSSANAFLDAAVHARQSAGLNVVSINWDLWSDAGMAARRKVAPQLREKHIAMLSRGIRTEEGVDAFFSILNSGIKNVLVSRQTRIGDDKAATVKDAAQVATAQSSASPGQAVVKSTGPTLSLGRRYPRPQLKKAYVAPETELEIIVAGLWADLLNLEKVGLHDDFFELGGHSLLALQLIPRLRNRFEIELAPRDFFTASTVAGVAMVIEEKLIAELEATDQEQQDAAS